MKSIKSIFVGASAGLLSLASAHASDIAEKATRAEDTRLCEAYGAGFYVVPRTVACMRIGGFALVDGLVGTTSGDLPYAPSTTGQQIRGTSNYDSNYSASARLAVNTDTRAETEFGTFRAFGQFQVYRGPFSGAFSSQGLIASGVAQSPRASAVNLDRAFLELAGFTAGYASSFFNFYTGHLQFWGNYEASYRGAALFAYTAQLGHGVSGAISLEDGMYRRYSSSDSFLVTNSLGAVSLVRPASGPGGLTYGGQKMPDIIAHLKTEQQWGAAQVMGALHQLTDYGSNLVAPAPVAPGAVPVFPTTTAPNKFGWAVGAGLRRNLDMLGQGDTFWLQGVYSEGALDYAFGVGNQGGDRSSVSGAGNIAGLNGLITQARDAAVIGIGPGTGGVIQAVKAWSLASSFRHFWTPALRSSIFGGYADIDAPTLSTLWDVKYWNIGANTIWSPGFPFRNVDLGVEVVYHNIRSRTQTGLVPIMYPSGSPRAEEGAWISTIRAQYNF